MSGLKLKAFTKPVAKKTSSSAISADILSMFDDVKKGGDKKEKAVAAVTPKVQTSTTVKKAIPSAASTESSSVQPQVSKSKPEQKVESKTTSAKAITDKKTVPVKAPTLSTNVPNTGVKRPLAPLLAAQSDTDDDEDGGNNNNTKSQATKKQKLNNAAAKPTATVAPSKQQQQPQPKAKSTAVNKPALNDAKAELDDLFGELKQNKTTQQKLSKNKQLVNNKSKATKPSVASDTPIDFQTENNSKVQDDMGWLDGGDTGRKRTEEGFLIYTYDELKFEEGGDTPLCPFDCECCYA